MLQRLSFSSFVRGSGREMGLRGRSKFVHALELLFYLAQSHVSPAIFFAKLSTEMTLQQAVITHSLMTKPARRFDLFTL